MITLAPRLTLLSAFEARIDGQREDLRRVGKGAVASGDVDLIGRSGGRSLTPSVAVPLPLSVKVTPAGNVPVLESVAVGVPVVVTVKLHNDPAVNVAELALVIAGAWPAGPEKGTRKIVPPGPPLGVRTDCHRSPESNYCPENSRCCWSRQIVR